MPIEIIRTDITTLRVDAIVNAANSTLLGGGGVDGAIHKAAGPGLLAECHTLGGCAVGDAKITGGYHLPCKYVIHTVGPIWQNGFSGEEAQLRSCYARSLALADRHGCRSVAFPLISSGAFGYPKAQALRVAMDEISSFLLYHDMQVYVVVYSQEALRVGEQLYAHIAQYIDDCYVAQRMTCGNTRGEVQRQRQLIEAIQRAAEYETYGDAAPSPCMAPAPPARAASEPSLAELLKQLDESFTQMLLRKIDERGMTDPQCYKRANIDRKLFAKIRGNIHYQPSKRTALALAISLELSLEETRDLLTKAGYALSHASEFDVIIEYFIVHEQYDIHQINQALFAFDQPLLGA